MSWNLTISVSFNIDPTWASIILTGFFPGFWILWIASNGIKICSLGFLIKELYVKPKGILSLQKHHHRAEHWFVTKGNPRITLNKDSFIKKPNENIFIPLEANHINKNPGKKPVKIIEAQVGSILKETDIVRFEDVYGRIS